MKEIRDPIAVKNIAVIGAGTMGAGIASTYDKRPVFRRTIWY